MKMHAFTKATRRALVLAAAALLAAIVGGGCGQAADPDVDLGDAPKLSAETCCSGAYICSTTGVDFGWDDPGCGPDGTKLRAQQICTSHCTGGTCTATPPSCFP